MTPTPRTRRLGAIGVALVAALSLTAIVLAHAATDLRVMATCEAWFVEVDFADFGDRAPPER